MSKRKEITRGKNSLEQKKELKKVNKKNKIFFIWFSAHLSTILYVAILVILWIYVILNWEKCIAMQFFTKFDGNNILFLVGILLTMLPFYEIEGKGIKLHRIKIKSMREELQGATSKYQEKNIEIQMDKLQLRHGSDIIGGEGNNELSKPKQTNGY